ncbi:MAG: fumarylacetoacetate hydrolase family protein [Ignavibacteria bacterium]
MKKINIRNSSEEFIAGKIVCVGRNYEEHARELGHNEPDEFPIIFLKPASNIIFSGEKVVHPSYSNNLHYETELVLLIGETVKDAKDLDEAEKAIDGYGVGLDMTLRDIQNAAKDKGDPWTIAKCFDTAAVLSDFILKSEYRLTMNEVIRLKVNGEIRQNCSLNKMTHTPAQLVKYISSVMTLEKGDLIYTGTPAGVSRVVKGDKLEAEISLVAVLETEIT